MEGPLILDRYRKINSAGCGGSGSVDICWDTRIQRRVAIKKIPLNTQGPLSGEGIPGLAEARTAALLKHPAIVSLIDFEVEQNDALLIMEAVEGPSLSNVIDSTGPGELDLDIITTVTEAMASALDYAHENQVLHLDIKPDNILIDLSGRPKVSDFGIAELADAQGFNQACGGTIGYMPPEQICGQELDQRCDLFSLAMCVYEMLTGDNPFFADDIDESLRKIETFSFDPPSAFRDDIDPALDDVLLTAMQPQRDMRQETVVDFMEEIRPFLGSAKAGQALLRQSINDEEDCENDACANDSAHKVAENSLWNKFSQRTKFIAGRACAAVLSWGITAFALMGFGILKTSICLLCALIPAVIAAIVPCFGAVAALCTLGAALIYLPQMPTVAGIVLIAITVVWLFNIVPADSDAAVNITLAAAPLAIIYATPFVPLLAGYVLRPKAAVFTTLTAGMLIMTLGLATGTMATDAAIGAVATDAAATGAAATGTTAAGAIATTTDPLLNVGTSFVQNTSPFALLCSAWGDPVVWISYVSWVIAALLMSLCCGANKKLLCMLGAFLATAILFGVQLFIQWMHVKMLVLPSVACCLAHAGAFLCIIVICAIGVIPRIKAEEITEMEA